MDSLHFNIYTSLSLNAKWTPHISTFTLQIHSVLHGQPTFQHLLFRFLACYIESPHFLIFSSDFRHATGTAYISTLNFRFLPCYMESTHFNIFSSDFRHATGTAYFSTFTLQIPSMLHGQSTFEHLVCRFLSC